MNILILSNNARNYYKFFNKLGSLFSAEEHNVVYAVDSYFSYDFSKLKHVDRPVYIFEEFLVSFKNDKNILERYKADNLNVGYLADFERAQFNKTLHKISKTHNSCAQLAFFESILRTHSIDFILFEDIANTFSYHSYLVGKQFGATYISIAAPRLPNRFLMYSGGAFCTHTEIEKTLQAIESGVNIASGEIKQLSENYLNNLATTEPDYMKSNGLSDLNFISRNTNARDKLHLWFNIIKHSLKFKGGYVFGNPLKIQLAIMARTITRNLKAKKLSSFYSQPVLSENFILYPLHYHPEASTSVLAGTYFNEYETIRNIAFNLPVGTKLYVKDHKSAYGFPELSFYKSLTKLPNVKVIEPFFDTKKLIKASKAVITLTSTVGYEALLLNKRVFLFGNVFYQFHPNVVRIENPAKLFNLFQEWLCKPLEQGDDYNLKFIQAYYLTTLPGSSNIAGKDSDKLAVELFPLISEYLSSMKLHSPQN